jgi:hypothetical protein
MAGEGMDFEQKLAQKLACNDKTVRDRAVKKLRKYLEARSQSQKSKGPLLIDRNYYFFQFLIHVCVFMYILCMYVD